MRKPFIFGGSEAIPKAKQELREEIKKLTKEFVKKGGKIQKLKSGWDKDD